MRLYSFFQETLGVILSDLIVYEGLKISIKNMIAVLLLLDVCMLVLDLLSLDRASFEVSFALHIPVPCIVEVFNKFVVIAWHEKCQLLILKY